MDQIIFRDIFEILPLPGNAKEHDIPGIQQSIRDFGFADPIGVNPRNNFDLDGNGRLEALRLMFDAGEPCPREIRETVNEEGQHTVRRWFVPTVNLNYTDEEQELLAVRLNAENLKKGFNNEALLSILDRAKAAGQLQKTGLDDTAHYTVRTLVEQARQLAQNGNPNDQPPANFQQVNPATMVVDYVCPNCRYGWSGKPKPTGDTGAGANIQPVQETAGAGQETALEQQETTNVGETTLPNQQPDAGANQ